MTRIANGTAIRIASLCVWMGFAVLGSGCVTTTGTPQPAKKLEQVRKNPSQITAERAFCVDAVGGCQEPIVIRQKPIFIAQPPIRIKQPPIRVEQPPIRVRNRPIVIEQPRVVLAKPRIDMDKPMVHVEKPRVIVEKPQITIRPAEPCQGPNCGVQRVNVRQPVMMSEDQVVDPSGRMFTQKGGGFIQKGPGWSMFQKR